MRVIIADSSSALRSALTALLRREGYEVVGEAADARALLAMLAKARPDILCLDHALDHCDSSALIKSLHAHEQLRDVSVIMMTAEVTEDVRTEATHAGVAGFLRKPFSQQQVIEELRQVAHARRMLSSLAGKSAAPVAQAGRRRVVIADDSETQRKLLRAILEDAGCEVVGEADNGGAAVKLVCDLGPDMACLDLEMPIMNGLEALSQIAAAKPGLPVLMITSHTERELVREAAARGARGYIVKPYQPEKVREAIGHLLGAPSPS